MADIWHDIDRALIFPCCYISEIALIKITNSVQSSFSTMRVGRLFFPFHKSRWKTKRKNRSVKSATGIATLEQDRPNIRQGFWAAKSVSCSSKHTLPNLVIPLSTCIFICDLHFDGYAPYVDNKNAIIVNQIDAYGLFCCIEDWYGSSSNEGNLNTAICIEKE